MASDSIILGILTARRPRVVSALARRLLSSHDPISRYPALWRRIQINGTGRLRESIVLTGSGKLLTLRDDGSFALNLNTFAITIC